MHGHEELGVERHEQQRPDQGVIQVQGSEPGGLPRGFELQGYVGMYKYISKQWRIGLVVFNAR